jgi:hypothetical protein
MISLLATLLLQAGDCDRPLIVRLRESLASIECAFYDKDDPTIFYDCADGKVLYSFGDEAFYVRIKKGCSKEKK